MNLTCPACGAALFSASSARGASVQCEVCGALFIAEEDAAPAASFAGDVIDVHAEPVDASNESSPQHAAPPRRIPRRDGVFVEWRWGKTILTPRRQSTPGCSGCGCLLLLLLLLLFLSSCTALIAS